MIAIVDTNVPIVANRRSEQASIECVLACAQQLQQITQRGKLALDDQWRILKEYMKHLSSSGQPGVGDAFLKWALNNIANPARVETVPITPCNPDDPDGTDFREFPDDPALAKFDPADRKFVAVAIAHPQHPRIMNATDRDWWNFKDTLHAHGVEVEFLCDEAKHS
ncbi:MAG: hypothetical protein KBH93_11465 [Anaerolineae bacterium]|nr:hypothetical protein [Anaerolineae bacterium]